MMPDWLVWLGFILGLIASFIAINDKVRSWLRNALGGDAVGKAVANIIGVFGVIVICAALTVGARAVFNPPSSSGCTTKLLQ